MASPIPYTHGKASDCSPQGHTVWKYIPTSSGGPGVSRLSSSCNSPNKPPLVYVNGETGSLIEDTLLAGTTYSEYRAIICCLSSGATSGQMVIPLPSPGDAPPPQGDPEENGGPQPPPQKPCPDVPLLKVLRPIFRRTLDLSQRLERLACTTKWMAILLIILLLLCLVLLFLLLRGG